MDVPRDLVALRLKTGGLTIAVVLPLIFGGALPLPRAIRTACLAVSLTASIAGITASRRLIREEGYYAARLEMFNEAFQSELAFQTDALERALEAEYSGSTPDQHFQHPTPLTPLPGEGVGGVTPSNTSPTPDQHLSNTSLTPPPLADPFATEIEPSIRGLVVMMRRQEMTQAEIILKVWGVPKGTNDRYKAALEKYRQILLDAGLN